MWPRTRGETTLPSPIPTSESTTQFSGDASVPTGTASAVPTFDPFILKQPAEEAHGPMSISERAMATPDWKLSAQDLTLELVSTAEVKTAFSNHPEFDRVASAYKEHNGIGRVLT